MSRAGKPTDNPVNESLYGWIKEELLSDFGLEREHRWMNIIRILNEYVKFYNEQRPCFAIGYDTPENYRKRYYKGELPRKNTFETREASPEPKFVRERREKSDYPYENYKDMVDFFLRMDMTQEELDKIWGGNAEKYIFNR